MEGRPEVREKSILPQQQTASELECIAECTRGAHLESMIHVVLHRNRERHVSKSCFLHFPRSPRKSPHGGVCQVKVYLSRNLHRENGIVGSRVHKRHKFGCSGKAVAENYIKVGARGSIRKCLGVGEKHAAYLTPATNPSSANGILNRTGSSSPRERAKTAVARMESPVATI